ncbi:MAG TPA: NB-ARC domain-containing protein [Jatrophihabitans sp.]|nr:NB-ARC domain-containing protein [Jatrophihabitans sp.]
MIEAQLRSRPDPDQVFTLGDLAHELGLLRSRAAHGTRSGKVGLDDLARRVQEPRSTVHAYITGKRLPPSEVLDRIVIALHADPAEQRQWAEAWYRVSANRGGEHRTPAAASSSPAGESAPHQLLPDAPAFTGRQQELALLDQVSARQGNAVRISAITGTAGVGKTALAVHWCHNHAERFPDGCLYVDLRGYDSAAPVDPAQALAGFLRALGCGSSEPGTELAERAAQYRSAVAGRRMLIVLDNARDTEQLRWLLPGSASSYVLVTSRDNLSGLVARHGARRIDLDLLPMPDAAALLRALLDPRLAADPDTLATVAAQCGRLPLALRIAAEYLDARPGAQLRELAAELSGALHPLDLFDLGGDPSCSIRSVFSWSYRQLDRSAARAFVLIGRQPATGFAPIALEASGELTQSETRQALEALVRGHLVQQVDPGRYRMHPLLHDYAAELASPDRTGSTKPDRAESGKTRLAKAELARPEPAAIAPTPPPELSVLPPELSVLPTVPPQVARRAERGRGLRPSTPVWRG